MLFGYLHHTLLHINHPFMFGCLHMLAIRTVFVSCHKWISTLIRRSTSLVASGACLRVGGGGRGEDRAYAREIDVSYGLSIVEAVAAQ